MQYATPDVLVAQLPHELMATVLTKALAAGQLSAAAILETATARDLAEHLEPEILWRCIDDIAALSELATEGGAARPEARRWLGRVLQRALDAKLLAPTDVLRFVPPSQFVKDAPLGVVAEIIRAGLTRGTFNADVVLAHLTPEVIAENLATHLVWACVADAAVRTFELASAEAPAAVPAPAPAVAKAATAPAAKSSSEKSAPVKTATSLLNGGTKPAAAPPAKPASKPAGAPPAPASWEDDGIDAVEEAPLPPAPPTPAAIRADRR